MRTRYPRFERHTSSGIQVLRDGLVLAFFMRRSHREAGGFVFRALERYRQQVGSERLGFYTSPEGHLAPLDTWAENELREQLRGGDSCLIELWEHHDKLGGYRFEYRGQDLDSDRHAHTSDAVSGVTFWLPTEYLEEQGPARVKELAVALARELPLATGYVSLAFNGLLDMGAVRPMIQELHRVYPSLDVPDLEASIGTGTRPKGAFWLNFYGQPALNELGGADGLREQMTLPGISIQELERDKVLVALGEWPEFQDETPAYQQLARRLGT